MFVLSYSKDWADIVVVQLAARHQTRDPERWCYACICVGERFEPILETHYLEINDILGPYLHMFSLYPPPANFVSNRLNELRERSDRLSVEAKSIYKDLLTKSKGAISRERMDQERLNLLSDLREAGLPANHNADFVFLGFRRNQNRNLEIDVLAVETSPLPESATPHQILNLFASMAKMAEKHYKANHTVSKFVGDLRFKWTWTLTFKEARDWYEYISSFIQTILNRN